jgi:hypothetical protein
VGKSTLTFSAEYGQQILDRVAAGQSPEDVATQFGRTPQTIHEWLSVASRRAARQSRHRALLRGVRAFGNELVASMFSWREARYAVQTSREMLKLYWIVSASHPGLAHREIYQKVVMARTGASLGAAEAIVRRAEQSFANWPTEREVTFSDVVHYMAVSEYLASVGRAGTRIDMGRVVAGRVPENL